MSKFNSTIHRTISEPLISNNHEYPKTVETGSTVSQLPPDVDMNKLERGDLVFDTRPTHEKSPILRKPPVSDYRSIPLNETASAPAVPLQISAREIPDLPRRAYPEAPNPDHGNGNANENNGSYMSPITTWLWRLYYSNRTVFYCVIGLIIIVTTLYTAFTGEGSKYYVVILRASACYVFGTDRAQSLFGQSFCDFGDRRK
ncbi:LANO_0H24278g1_1 [Lachancea nothofagi CBS 11611]|uniref:LANO_0H24278g1_1 n=1 Tax=Lachancea nothofagi CBS 11611 TaxID=1266666 RepID=A0A1G4KP08_9SACH|nr:LANO_0H24278g1_1 [Lachancea nothofagi CBS 11611]